VRLRNAINWLEVSSKAKRVYCKSTRKSFYFKISFITLTVPPQGNRLLKNSEFKGLLHAWIVYAQKYFYLKNYVWKVEAHKDGRLHVHLTTDAFIHYRKLRDSWNRLLRHKGLLENHYNQHGNYDPNSTDIHSVKAIENISGYIAAYMAKKAKLSEGFTGKIWSCSYNLSAKKKCSVNISADELSVQLKKLYSRKFRYKLIKSKNRLTGVERNVAEIFFLSKDLWKELKGLKVHEAYDNKRFDIRNNIPDIPPEYYEFDFDKKLTNTLTQCGIETSTQQIGSMKSVQQHSSEQNSNAKSAGSNIGKQLQLQITEL
jgi:hypothetical protein